MPHYDATTAECLVLTYKEGLLSAVAHDLEIRVARFAQGPWSSMGEINRAPQLAMRIPSSANEPSIAIGDGKAGPVTQDFIKHFRQKTQNSGVPIY